MEGKVTERNVVVALFAVSLCGEGIVATGRRKLRLGRCHQGSGVSPFALGPRQMHALPWRTTP